MRAEDGGDFSTPEHSAMEKASAEGCSLTRSEQSWPSISSSSCSAISPLWWLLLKEVITESGSHTDSPEAQGASGLPNHLHTSLPIEILLLVPRSIIDRVHFVSAQTEAQSSQGSPKESWLPNAGGDHIASLSNQCSSSHSHEAASFLGSETTSLSFCHSPLKQLISYCISLFEKVILAQRTNPQCRKGT